MAEDMANVKDAKESFVRGLSGTSFGEVYAIVCVSTTWLLVRHLGILCVPPIRRLHYNSKLFAFMWDYVTTLVPATLAMTVLADHILFLFFALVLLVVLYLALLISFTDTRRLSSQGFLSLKYPTSLPCLREVRVWTNILTAIAILGVDFHIFPRRLAKVETYGNGLMDIGIGCFMLCHGMVAREARYPEEYKSVPSLLHYFKTLAHTAYKTWPFVLIGALRLLSVKATDYQEHVTEYGVHWNFFFTIAVVRILATAFQPIVSLVSLLPHGLAAIFTAGVYQLFLSRGLSDYIIYGPNGDYSRPTLLSANREGVLSCVGHLAIFFSGVEIGKHLFRQKGKSVRDMIKTISLLIVVFLLLVPVIMWADENIQRNSRRFANLTYILWTISVFGVVLTVSFMIDIITLFVAHLTNSSTPPMFTPGPSPSSNISVISAIDYNQFVYFILANLLTGLVNFSVDTLHTGPAPSLLIMLLYMITLALAVTLLHQNNIKIV